MSNLAPSPLLKVALTPLVGTEQLKGTTPSSPYKVPLAFPIIGPQPALSYTPKTDLNLIGLRRRASYTIKLLFARPPTNFLVNPLLPLSLST